MAVRGEEVLSTISAQDIPHKIVVLISNFLTVKNCVFLSVIKLNKIKILFNLGELEISLGRVSLRPRAISTTKNDMRKKV